MKNYNKALVLGSTGQGGSFMVKHLLKKGYYVYAFVRKSATGNLQNLENVINHKRLKIVHGDLIDLVSLEQIIKKNKFNEIYNFADQDHVKWSFEIPAYSFLVTASSVINILEIIKNSSPDSKYFQPLSSNMFGESKNKKQNENEPLTPKSIYALGKVAAYHACKMYNKVYKLKIYGAIFFNHESEVRPEEYVTRKITKAVARIYYGKQKKLKLGNISSKIDWGYAKDYIEISHKIMSQKKPDFFVIGSGKNYSIKQFVEKCFKYVELDYKKYVEIDKKLFRPSNTVSLLADTKKAQKILNFRNKTSLDQLIKIMMDNDLRIENAKT